MVEMENFMLCEFYLKNTGKCPLKQNHTELTTAVTGAGVTREPVCLGRVSSPRGSEERGETIFENTEWTLTPLSQQLSSLYSGLRCNPSGKGLGTISISGPWLHAVLSPRSALLTPTHGVHSSGGRRDRARSGRMSKSLQQGL